MHSRLANPTPTGPAHDRRLHCDGDLHGVETVRAQHGFAGLWLRAARLDVHGCAVHEKIGKRWAQLPARPRLDQDHQLARDDAGKIRYWPVMDFAP